MRRRALLVSAVAALAGCSQADEAATDTTAQTSTVSSTDASAETTTSTETAIEEPLRVTEVTAPGSVGIGATATLSVTVENRGSESATYESSVSKRVTGGEWQTTDATVSITVPAGGSTTEEVDVPGHDFLAAGSYRLDEGEHVARTRFAVRELAVGDAYTTPYGVEVTIQEVAFSDTYTYETGEGERIELTPSNDEQWAVVQLAVTNTGTEPVRAPGTEAIVLQRGESEFGDRHFDDNPAKYSAIEIGPDVTVEAEIPTDVPADADPATLHVHYEEELEGGRAEAHWQLSG